MRNLSYAHNKGNDTWFVFDLETGQTVRKNLADNRMARSTWLVERGVGELDSNVKKPSRR